MTNKKNKNAQQKKQLTRDIIMSSFYIFVLLIVISLCGVYLINNHLFDDKINFVTANYLTLNDVFDSDVIKLENLSILSDKKGLKTKGVDFSVTRGKKNGTVSYEILLVPISDSIDYSKIKVFLATSNNKELVFDSLDSFSDEANRNGKIIYSNKLKGKDSVDKYKLKVWIDDSVDKKEVEANLFEVKIKIK